MSSPLENFISKLVDSNDSSDITVMSDNARMQQKRPPPSCIDDSPKTVVTKSISRWESGSPLSPDRKTPSMPTRITLAKNTSLIEGRPQGNEKKLEFLETIVSPLSNDTHLLPGKDL